MPRPAWTRTQLSRRRARQRALSRLRIWVPRLGKLVPAVVALLALWAAIYKVDPLLQPCAGQAQGGNIASIVALPGVYAHDYDRRHRLRLARANPRGAEVRFTITTTGLGERNLTVSYTLITVNSADMPDGTDPNQNNAPGPIIALGDRAHELRSGTGKCEKTINDDGIFVTIPHRGASYRVILDVYDQIHAQFYDRRLSTRETPTFIG